MKTIDYILNGFGFLNFKDFLKSTFGHTMDRKIILLDSLLAFAFCSVNTLFGFNVAFFTAYVVLLVFEWFTGVKASFKKGESHSSRKFGRMLLKIATYLVPIYILNQFSKNSEFPIIMGYEVDPFIWLYWAVLLGIIWQLFISLLENLNNLGYKYASVLIRIINKQFYEKFEIDETKST
ncbi:phage holin family protein [Flavobacterium sp. TN-1]